MSSRLLLAAVAAAIPLLAEAADFAPRGAKGTLQVDYTFESAGRRSSEGAYDPYEWRVKRTVSLAVDLAAEPPTTRPVVRAMDATQVAALKGDTRKMEAAVSKMAPSAAAVQKSLERCGDDEACMAREIQKMGFGMQGSGAMADAMAAKNEVQGLRPGAPRYQAWVATAQRGTYAIDEKVQVSVTDPICIPRPRHRCTRSETRTGSGEVPLQGGGARNPRAAAGFSAVEVDSGGKTLTLRLPVPLAPLPYTETIVSDEPAGTYDTPIPKGPQARQLLFRAGGKDVQPAPVTVALRGDWRSQQGEHVIDVPGDKGQGGKLVVRWRFAAR